MSAAQSNVTETPRENLYEGMFLVDSSNYANDPDATVQGIMAVLERAEANVVAHGPWQDGKLAYEIEGRRKGLHYLVCFKMAPSQMDVITRQSHLSDTILRQLCIKHPPELFNALVSVLNGATEEAEATAAADAPAAE